jgi:Uma2 family endonuclease
MTLSIDHERIKNTLHDLIVAHCQDEEVEYISQGSATLRIPRDRGKEPDDSFVFGELKKSRPDMVLEVVITSGAIDNLEFYAPFRIPEVWVWESSGLNVFILDGGRYKKAKKSKLLPKFDAALAGSLATSQSTSQAVREFRKGR